MEKKKRRSSITVEKETVLKLNKLKYKFGCDSIDEVIIRLLAILTKFKLAEEFKGIKK